MARFLVYGLCDPRTGDIRYVGKTTRTLCQRLLSHCAPSHLRKTSHKINWVKSLLVCGLVPLIEELEVCASTEAMDEAERFHIKFWREMGAALTNATDGGDGFPASFKRPATFGQAISYAKRQRARPFIDQNGKIYLLLKDAATEVGASTGDISAMLMGKRCSVKGYVFSYVDQLNGKLPVYRPSRNPSKSFVDQYGRQYMSQVQAERMCGVSQAEISRALRGIPAFTKGFIFRYPD